jgi:hypothetical protein
MYRCSCGKCTGMPSILESRCCHSISLCDEKRCEHQCVTLHGGFIVNCLTTHVLELAFYDYLDNYGPVGDEEPINELVLFFCFIYSCYAYDHRSLCMCIILLECCFSLILITQCVVHSSVYPHPLVISLIIVPERFGRVI